MKKFTTMLAKLLGLTEAPAMKDGKLELTQEQENSLQEQLGADDMATLMEQVTSELSGVADIRTQLQQARENAQTQATELDTLTQRITELTTQNATLTSQVATLSAQPEDNPNAQPLAQAGGQGSGSSFRAAVGAAAVVLGSLGVSALWGGQVKEVGGQLMGEEGKLWATDRPWNNRALKRHTPGVTFGATNFNDGIVIERLNGDLEDFIRQNPSKIEDIYTRYFNLPEAWRVNTIYGVADRITTATITTSEVTQPRKDGWLPKGSASIKPEEMRVRPAQIDLQFDYIKMVAIETNWINSFNREGTQAYKMTFIEYLITQYLMQARSEDANVLINGVFVETPEGYDYPVSYLLRNDGVLKLLFDARGVKYRPFDLGIPTESNIVDYIGKLIQSLPDDVRTTPLELSLSPSWIRAYKVRDEQLRGTNNNYTGYPETPRDYPNITFVPVAQFEGSDVMFITPPGNIAPMEFKPEEKSMLTIEKDRRTVYVFGDYRIGIGFKHFGLETQANDPLKFRKQVVWSNNTPLFRNDFFVSFYDEGTGIAEVRHNRVQPGKGFTTDITKFTGKVGPILIIRGDQTLATAVNIKNGTDIALAGSADFNLKTGGTLTLVKQANGTYKEVSRTTAPEVVSSVVKFTGTSVDYASGNSFAYTGASSVSLADVLNGVEGNTVRIYGQATNTLTVASVANKIKVNSSALLDTEAKYIDLVKVGGLWVEMGRG